MTPLPTQQEPIVLLLHKLASFIESHRQQHVNLQDNSHQLYAQPTDHKRNQRTPPSCSSTPLLQLTKTISTTSTILFPQRPVLCDSLPPGSLPKDDAPTPESLRQRLNEFCHQYSIPEECRPIWKKQGDFDTIHFGIPFSSPIYDIISSLAEYRTTAPKRRPLTSSTSTSSSASISQHVSNAVSIESRNTGGQSRVRLVITPRTRLHDNSREFPTIIEVISSPPTQGAGNSTASQFASVELKKASGQITADDVNTVELALYLGHVKAPSPSSIEQQPPVSISPFFEDPFDFWTRPSTIHHRHHNHNQESLEDQFFKSIQSSFFGPDIFSLFGSFPNDMNKVDDEQSFSLGRPMNVIDWSMGSSNDDIHGVKQRQSLMNSDEQKIKRKLESMGTKVYLPSDERESLEWSDLAGYEDAKRSIEETLLLGLTHPEVFNKVTAATRGKSGESSRPRMILFKGPPGTGKTSTARIIASQVKLPLIYVSLECIVSKWFGESEKNLGTIFDLARALGELHSGCVIFVDEIDSLASSRDDLTSHEASRRILSILLRRLDGFDTQHDKTVLICATNRERDLDEAFRSRVDVTVTFPLPDQKGRCQIIRRYAKHLTDDEIDSVASYTDNLSGRNIRDLCQIAERRWVAHLLRESGTITSVADSSSAVDPRQTSGPVNFAVSPPPVDFYLAAAEQKQSQQT